MLVPYSWGHKFANTPLQCAVPDCTVKEWKDTGGGSGSFNDLLAVEKNTNIRHLLGLNHDPFMFHQANMNYNTVSVPKTTINGVSAKYSLLQAWVETIVQELIRMQVANRMEPFQM
jgi:hypothetical protein